MNSTNAILEEKIFTKFKKDSWEIKSMGEIVTEIISGNEITKAQLGTGNHPALRFKQIHDSQIEIKDLVTFVDADLIKNKKYAENGDLLITQLSENLEDSGKACVYLGDQRCLIGNHITIIKSQQNSKFLSFYLSSDFAKSQISQLTQKSTVYVLYPSKIKQIKIPLPPPEIQQQIVEFLDKFMKLEKELEKELENRKIQYEYYKNRIFNRGINEKKWEIKSLGEIATNFSTGNGVTRDQLDSGDYPAIKAGDVNSSLNLHFEKCCSFVNHDLIKKPKYFYKNDILFSGLGSEKTIGTVCAYLGEEKCILGECVTSMSHNQNPKFLSFALSTEFSRKQFKEKSTQNQLYRLHTSKIKQIKIPLPSLEIQNEVVEQLDKLYRIINDIKDGIPMLIQKNREQYNYYKELLLKR